METVNYLDELLRDDCNQPPHLLLNLVEGQFNVLPDGDRCEMDAGVWSRLPEEMLERILALLPVEAQFRCRSVCQKWRELLWSARFQRLAASVLKARHRAPVLCTFEYRPGQSRGRFPDSLARVNFPMFATYRVYKLDLTFLPAKFREWQRNRIVCEDGLICLKVSEPPYLSADVLENFCVLNPVTRSWKELPQLNVHQHRCCVMKVQADRVDMGEFRVTLVCGPDSVADRQVVQHQCTTAVYSSKAGAWKLITANMAAAPIYTCRSVLYSGMVYCMGERNRIVLHGMEDGKLTKPMELGTPVLGQFPTQFELIQHHEQLLLVGQFNLRNPPSFGIWRLDRKRLSWELVTEVPRDLHDRLVKTYMASGKAEISIDSFGGAAKVGHIIFIIVVLAEHPRFFSRRFFPKKTWTHILAFNIVEQVWEIYLEDAGDLVPQVSSTSGFIELRLNDYL